MFKNINIANFGVNVVASAISVIAAVPSMFIFDVAINAIINPEYSALAEIAFGQGLAAGFIAFSVVSICYIPMHAHSFAMDFMYND